MPAGPASPPGPDPASCTDLAFLSMDSGPVPEQFAAVLMLTDPALDVPPAHPVLAERIAAIPRLRQRLVRAPVGCGSTYAAMSGRSPVVRPVT